MEKLYIPTTTLNFNNILSTESISPKSLYENRNFGYRRFETVEPSKFENSLIAYSKIPYFKINDDKLDNYPLIIEVSKDMIRDLKVIDKINNIENTEIKVFQILQTIYLHPNKVKFLFLNEEHKKITLIKAEPSIETKLLPLYQAKMQILDKKNTFKWEKKYLEKIIEENIDIKQHIYNDTLINKIKGFYFCYTLGEIYSKLTIKDNINMILNNNRHKRQQAQSNADYQAIYKINEKENKYLKEKVIKSLKINTYKTLNLNNNKLTSFNKHNDVSELYKNSINDTIDFDTMNTKEDFKINRLELLKKIGDNFKYAYFDGKDKSIEYIRNLMRHIKNYAPFEAESIDIKNYDILLKSLAYFILKGDDLEKLLNSLKENNLLTFKIAFGLWGALFGFSAIPKTISNILFEEKTKDIIDIQDFLKEMYKKIHNFDIQEDIKIIFIENKHNQKNNNNQNREKNFKCPKCNSDMIEKEIRKGNFKGYKFYGCKKWQPDGKGCNGKRDLDGSELDNNFKPINQSFSTQKSMTKIEIIDKIYQFIDEYGIADLEGKKLSFAKVKNMLNKENIKVPNRNKKFDNSDIRELIKADNRISEIGNPKKPYLQLKCQ